MAEAKISERVVAGRYRLIEPIGRGGMGTVWRAHDQGLDRDVAVKELIAPPELTGHEREVFALRTFREARAAGRLSHPGVAAVYDVFEENGHPWIVMELVPSRTLGAIVTEEGPLHPRRVAEIGSEVLAALRAAHAAGVLHRDVKPDNVLIADTDGRAVLTDFGIAALEDDSPVTRTGALIGTPAFIAPERASGAQAQRESDLWSLGVTLFLAVEGNSPFNRGTALSTLAAVLYEEPGRSTLAGPLTPVIEGLLRKNPAERMSADDAAARLAAVAAGLETEPLPVMPPVPMAPDGPTGPVGPAGRAHKWLLTAATTVLVLLVGLVAGAIAYMTSQAPDSSVTVPPLASPSAVKPAKTTEAAKPTPEGGNQPGRARTRQPADTPRPSPKAEKTDKPGKGDGGPGKGTGKPEDTKKPSPEDTASPDESTNDNSSGGGSGGDSNSNGGDLIDPEVAGAAPQNDAHLSTT